jgi:hypothetical protein
MTPTWAAAERERHLRQHWRRWNHRSGRRLDDGGDRRAAAGGQEAEGGEQRDEQTTAGEHGQAIDSGSWRAV